MEIFWKTIGLYNAATWEWQLGIILIGIILTVLLTRNPQPWVKNGMKIYLIAVYLWISVIYYYIYCAERSYNEVMALFWAIMAILWGWDALSGYTTFERTRKYDWLAYFLFAMPFIYPLISMARGLTFPEITSPVMPCSVVVFTIGLLLFFSKNINMFIVLFLTHWSLIGLSKTYYFNTRKISCWPVLPSRRYIFSSKNISANNLHTGSKPNAKYVNLLLILVCVAIGILLTTTMFIELLKDK